MRAVASVVPQGLLSLLRTFMDLDPAAIDDDADAVIGAAQTQTQGRAEVALGGLGVGREVLEDAVVVLFVHR
jgi:hypothetical protein